MVQDARTANDETLAGRDDDRALQAPVYKRVIIMLGGPVMNLLFAIVLFAILLTGIGVQTATTTVAALSECVPQSSAAAECAPGDPAPPAAAAGIEPDDVIVSVGGAAVSTFAEVSKVIQASPGEQLTLVVERDGAESTITVTPASIEAPHGDGGTAQVGFLGIRPTAEYVHQPLWAGPAAAIENVGAVSGIIWQLPVKVYETAVTLSHRRRARPERPAQHRGGRHPVG